LMGSFFCSRKMMGAGDGGSESGSGLARTGERYGDGMGGHMWENEKAWQKSVMGRNVDGAAFRVPEGIKGRLTSRMLEVTA
jgi:hypothetical protein